MEAVVKTIKEYGRLDIMVNNAGISMVHPSEDLKPEDWRGRWKLTFSESFTGVSQPRDR